MLKFDGFPKESFDDLASCCKQWFGVPLSVVESSLRGYNWGSVGRIVHCGKITYTSIFYIKNN
jgi:hypothetical protein